MKFTFPFFKKKDVPAANQTIDGAVVLGSTEIIPPKVDWGSVEADGFLAPPSIVAPDSECMSSFEVFDIPASVDTSEPASASLGVDANEPLNPVKVSSQEGVSPVEEAAQADDQLLMTKADVIAAYKIFLNRQPESERLIEQRIGSPVESNLVNFVLANEFIRRPEVGPMILGIAKQIIDRQKAASASPEMPKEGQET